MIRALHTLIELMIGKTFPNHQIARRLMREVESTGDMAIIKNFGDIKDWFQEKYEELIGKDDTFTNLPYQDQAGHLYNNYYTPEIGQQFYNNTYNLANNYGYAQYMNPYSSSIYFGMGQEDFTSEGIGILDFDETMYGGAALVNEEILSNEGIESDIVETDIDVGGAEDIDIGGDDEGGLLGGLLDILFGD